MQYYHLYPEVAAQLGSRTKMDVTTGIPVVSHLHYAFYGWLGDDLMTTFPCYVVTVRLADALRGSGLTGFEFREIEVTASSEFRELYPKKKPPECVWLYINGKAGEDDFGIAGQGDLIVAETALDLLKTFKIKYCEISKWPLIKRKSTKKS